MGASCCWPHAATALCGTPSSDGASLRLQWSRSAYFAPNARPGATRGGPAGCSVYLGLEGLVLFSFYFIRQNALAGCKGFGCVQHPAAPGSPAGPVSMTMALSEAGSIGTFLVPELVWQRYDRPHFAVLEQPLPGITVASLLTGPGPTFSGRARSPGLVPFCVP